MIISQKLVHFTIKYSLLYLYIYIKINIVNEGKQRWLLPVKEEKKMLKHSKMKTRVLYIEHKTFFIIPY